ncbi:hypothetical protein [Geobacillus sp. YHL]|uniref:hypothetical protein n=1 Tax=Geobacillus sp. YHL TaxID=2796117 RepID=UPI001EF0DB4A|nr:hypothetical protein [Geobacillus sp. YHL]MCG6796364.1 hypothetical protein [Geobacillus sp. YHL]
MGIYIDNVEYSYNQDSIEDKSLDHVIIHFTYNGDQLECKGQVRLSPKEYEASGNGKDNEYLVKCILARELHYLVNG